jgi:maleate isomerase
VTAHRVGLVVPSSNVTVETEIPALLARHVGARSSFLSAVPALQSRS